MLVLAKKCMEVGKSDVYKYLQVFSCSLGNKNGFSLKLTYFEKLVAAAFNSRLCKPRDTSKEVEVGKSDVNKCLQMFICSGVGEGGQGGQLPPPHFLDMFAP